MAPKAGNNCQNVYTCVGLVDRVNVDYDIGAKHLALRAIESDTVECCKRVRWNHRAPPADYISIVVVMRRFNQDELEAFQTSWPRRFVRHKLLFRFDVGRQRQLSRFQSNGAQSTDDRLGKSRSAQVNVFAFSEAVACDDPEEIGAAKTPTTNNDSCPRNSCTELTTLI